VEDALGHRQGPLTDVERQEPLTLGLYGDPDPVRGARQALARLIFAAGARFEGTEHGIEFVSLHLAALQIVQEIVRKGLQLVSGLDQPLQDGIGIDLEHPRRAPDAQAFGQARDDPYNEVRRGPLPVKDGAEGLQKVAVTDDAQQLAPGTATGMAVGTEVTQPEPAAIATVRVRAEVGRGVDLTTASARHDDAWWWSGGGSRAGIGGVRTGVAGRFVGESCKGLGLTRALGPWRWGLRCRRAHGGVAGPRPVEHDAQPRQSDQHQLIEKEIGNHGKILSYKC